MPFDPHLFRHQLFSGQFDFDAMAAALWRYQVAQNPVMRDFAERLGRPRDEIISMPIAFFKHFAMQTGGTWEPEAVFTSSGTTGQVPSRHLVRDLSLYDQNSLCGFQHFFTASRYRILALLPSYLERGHSSLVRMVQVWMDNFGLPGSGFFLRDFAALRARLEEAQALGEPVLLIGVAFALLDFAEEQPTQLPPDTVVIETGGMKGRREELIRSELHARLCAGLGVEQVHSEYGMTELMSQAYTGAGGRFRPAPTLRVQIRDLHLDRLRLGPGITGRIHLIDLANLHSCAFIATDDLGRWHEDGTFEVLGRVDAAELRGCSLMYTG